MNEKIKKLAANLSELIPKSDTPQEVYDFLIPVMQKQSDYFNYLGPDNIIKLIIYIFSYNQGNGFNLGDKMIDSLGFANLFTSEGNTYEEECDNCSGSGETDCQNCDGTENVECDECSGEGEITCDYCDGYGAVEENGETVTCPECDGKEQYCKECRGDGEVSCDSCTSGKETCEYCDGQGEVETNEIKYDTYFVVTWNRAINGDFSLNENTKYPALSEYEFDRLRDEFIILTYNDDGHDKFQDWVKINEMYCTYYSDEPKLKLNEKMRVDNLSDWYEPDYYTT